jgi:hypothetical protein
MDGVLITRISASIKEAQERTLAFVKTQQEILPVSQKVDSHQS